MVVAEGEHLLPWEGGLVRRHANLEVREVRPSSLGSRMLDLFPTGNRWEDVQSRRT